MRCIAIPLQQCFLHLSYLCCAFCAILYRSNVHSEDNPLQIDQLTSTEDNPLQTGQQSSDEDNPLQTADEEDSVLTDDDEVQNNCNGTVYSTVYKYVCYSSTTL